MIKFPFIPRLVGYSVALPDEVWQTKISSLPIRQRHATHNVYTAQISFILNGVDHDHLMSFYNTYRADVVEMMLILDSSTLKPYPALFTGDAIITPLGMRKDITPTQISDGAADTTGAYYKSEFVIVVLVPFDKQADQQIVGNYEHNHFNQELHPAIIDRLQAKNPSHNTIILDPIIIGEPIFIEPR